jgi:hypothetical protein
MNPVNSADPFQVLGVARDAGEAEVRARYLELVKQFPPEREPDKFREIRAAYEAAKDPLTIARRLVSPPGEDFPKWSDVIEAQKRNPPRMTPKLVLSLGNRAAEFRPAASAEPDRIPQDSQSGNDPTPPNQATDAS